MSLEVLKESLFLYAILPVTKTRSKFETCSKWHNSMNCLTTGKPSENIEITNV